MRRREEQQDELLLSARGADTAPDQGRCGAAEVERRIRQEERHVDSGQMPIDVRPCDTRPHGRYLRCGDRLHRVHQRDDSRNRDADARNQTDWCRAAALPQQQPHGGRHAQQRHRIRDGARTEDHASGGRPALQDQPPCDNDRKERDRITFWNGRDKPERMRHEPGGPYVPAPRQQQVVEQPDRQRTRRRRRKGRTERDRTHWQPHKRPCPQQGAEVSFLLEREIQLPREDRQLCGIAPLDVARAGRRVEDARDRRRDQRLDA